MARYKLNKEMLAKIIGVSAKSLCNKMSGKTGFTLKEMKSIQSAIPSKDDLTLDYLFEAEDKAS